MPTPQPPIKIAIIGAGPAGLTLARLLHHSSSTTSPRPSSPFSITLFESDASPHSRTLQGGCLDLGASTGQLALRKCGLFPQFLEQARYSGEELRIRDKWGTCLVHLRGGRDRPEIDRVKLRDMLLGSVPEGWVRWGTKVKAVEKDTGELVVESRTNTDGSEKGEAKTSKEGPFDLVVGADGAWSKIRAHLDKHGGEGAGKPLYSGISGYEMEIPHPEKTCPAIDAYVGKGGMFCSGDAKAMNAQRMGDGSLKVRSWFRCGEGEATEMLKQDGQKGTVQRVLSRYGDWSKEITNLFREAELETLRTWTLYELPVGYTWEHKRGFTLIGDAASLATPFSGEGVNKAMQDAMELADLIIQSSSPPPEGEETPAMTLDKAVLEYEKVMFPRAEKHQAFTAVNKNGWFGPNAPLGAVTGSLGFIAGRHESVFVRMLGTAPVIGLLYSYLWIRQFIGWLFRAS